MKYSICVFYIMLFLLIHKNLHSQEKALTFLEKSTLVVRTEGYAFLGSGITEHDAKTLAIQDAKRKALEMAGTYLESHSEVLNYELVKDVVITYSAGLLNVNILNEERKIIDNMFALKVNIEAAIDTRVLNDRLTEIKNDYTLRKQLEAEREKNKKLEEKIKKITSLPENIRGSEVKEITKNLKAIEYYNKGLLTNRDDLKIKYYTKAIELEPLYLNAFMERGVTYLIDGKTDLAYKDLLAAFIIDSKNPIANFNLGFYYIAVSKNYTLESEEIEKALDYYSRAIEYDSTFVSAYFNRAQLYRNLGKNKEAVDDYNNFLKLHDNVNSQEADQVRRTIRNLGYKSKY